MKFIQILRDWSEVWALLIPLAVIVFKKKYEKDIRVLIGYVIIAFVLNLAANFMLQFYYLVPKWMYVNGMSNNNILYNIHSIVRVLMFSWYILMVRHYGFSFILKTLLAVYVAFVLINFIFIEPVFFLSTHLFAAESIMLLVICLSYFISSIQDESQVNWIKHPSFFVCAGVTFYEAITFFIFLFFYPLSQKDQSFFLVTMRIYNISFVVLCILLALAFYQSHKRVRRSQRQ